MKNYEIILSFLEPVEAVTFMEAETPEEAQKKVKELFQNRTNLQIVDVKEASDQPELPLDLTKAFEA